MASYVWGSLSSTLHDSILEFLFGLWRECCSSWVLKIELGLHLGWIRATNLNDQTHTHTQTQTRNYYPSHRRRIHHVNQHINGQHCSYSSVLIVPIRPWTPPVATLPQSLPQPQSLSKLLPSDHTRSQTQTQVLTKHTYNPLDSQSSTIESWTIYNSHAPRRLTRTNR